MGSALYIVSNRLPVTVAVEDGEIKVQRSSGGLASGLAEVHAQSSSFWVGHSGVFDNEPEFARVAARLAEDRLIAVPLKKKQYVRYYNGLANNAIWPLFHYFTTSMRFDYDDFEAYKEVNKAFAEKVLELVSPGDRVWVQDYQLMLLPRYLREADKNLRIAYFHHIPFPSSEIFRTMPRREEILHGLLGADYIGFHTYDYVRHFISAVSRIRGNDVHVDEIHEQDRLVKVAAHPLGIDFDGVEQAALRCPPKRPEKSPTFLGIDRLDYTKGIPERLVAFRDFLRANPQYVGQATFLQLCVPSRTDIQSYGALRAQVERLVGQINGEFGRPGYTPVEYLYRSLPFEEVVELYRNADVAVVTPLRDGLNLVCKEYVAAKVDEDGVLVLSEFAGAATEMGEALKVNPYDVQQFATVLKQAVEMPQEERKRRMSLLRERVRRAHNLAWAKSFLEAWDRSWAHASPKSLRLTGTRRQEVLETLAKAERVFLFLDNDGTLTPIAVRPEMAIPSAQVTRMLERFADLPEVIITIVTGRPRSYCEQYFGSLPVNLVAEHGAFYRDRESREWQVQMGLEEFEELKEDILGLLEMYVRFVPGSHIEKKETCLVWHYRQAEPEFAKSQARELSEALQSMLGKTSLSVFPGKKSVEIRQVLANKGFAVEHVLEQSRWKSREPFVTVGDDLTDEDMHRVHQAQNISIHVGKANVYAKYFAESTDDILRFLNEIHDVIAERKKSRGTTPSGRASSDEKRDSRSSPFS